MNTRHFDIAVLGGGPGGYVAAIRAAQLNYNVALVEAKQLGGTCLNRGCIPTKSLIANVDRLKKCQEAKEFGLDISIHKIDFEVMSQRKDSTVSDIRHSLTRLIKSNNIEIIQGIGKLSSPHTLKIQSNDNYQLINSDYIILATGSEPKALPSIPFDHQLIVDSTSILEWKTLPKSLSIIGGGYIGCEFACLYHHLGVKVTLIEALDHLIIREGRALSDFLHHTLEKQGITVKTACEVTGMYKENKQVTLNFGKGESPITTDACLVAIGRNLNTRNIDLDKAGVSLHNNGSIIVNKHMQTTAPHIYAIGDITAKAMLAHVASHQGIVAINHLANKSSNVMHYHAIPSVIFTLPELATVGLSVEEAKEQGYETKICQFPFQALGKSQATGDTEGFTQVVTDGQTGKILGAQVAGHEAATLIAEMTIAIQQELTLESISETVHAHPTLSESWLEAAYLGLDSPIHLPPKKVKG